MSRDRRDLKLSQTLKHKFNREVLIVEATIIKQNNLKKQKNKYN
jgi:hypothetical protein